MSCRGTTDPLEVACSTGAASWPIGIENDGIAAGVNYFTSKSLPPFFSIARHNRENDELWLFAALDRARLRSPEYYGIADRVANLPTEIDEVAPMRTRCGTGLQVLVGSSASAWAPISAGSFSPTSTSESRLLVYEWSGGGLESAAAPAILPGPLTALWSRPGAATAVAIVHHREADRYEAFEVGISCGR